MAELGFQYDSSVFPIQGHDVYGIPDAPRQPWKARPGLLEVPLSTARLMGRNLPVGGGGYFRFFPYPLTRWLLRRVNAEGNAVVVYLHPWEFDKDQPVLPVPWKSRFRHYFNIHRVAPRFARLCADFQFGPIREVFADDLQSGDSGKGLPRS